MTSRKTRPAIFTPVFVIGCAPLAMAQVVTEPKRDSLEPAVELSPFLVQENSSLGYYAAQTLAGGRLRQDIKDLGSSIQVITKEFIDDLSVTGIEDLFQYTTSTEVGGITG